MTWRIPLFDIDLGKEEIEEAARILKSGWLVMGPATERFERAFSEYLGVKKTFCVSSENYPRLFLIIT